MVEYERNGKPRETLKPLLKPIDNASNVDEESNDLFSAFAWLFERLLQGKFHEVGSRRDCCHRDDFARILLGGKLLKHTIC